MENTLQNDFNFSMPIDITKDSNGKNWFSGIASTSDKDLQGETVKAEGIILDYFLSKGWFNSNHMKETSKKVGVPTEAKITKNALWVKGYLLDTDEASGILELANALKKAGSDRKLGFSIEGKVLERDKKNPNIITKCWLKDIAITAEGVNPYTYADFFKSFGTQDLREVFINKSNNEEVDEVDNDPGEEKLDIDEQKEEGSEKPVDQKDIEEKDAEKTARTALNPKKDNEDIDKKINKNPNFPDVPKASTPKLKKSDIGTGNIDNTDDNDEDDEVVGGDNDETDKSFTKFLNMKKSFVLLNSLGGEREIGDKKVPLHTSTYKHKNNDHHITVTGKDGAFAIVHANKTPKKEENIGMHVFIDNPKTGEKAVQRVDEYLKGFGIKHKFADKNKLMGKSFIIAQDNSHTCDVCEEKVIKGNPFVIAEGKCFCDDDCMEKALFTGYQFGVTDQTNGAALRVEDLEGEIKDNGFGDDLKVKHVKFNTERANGGKSSVTIKDALEFLNSRGIPQESADRLLVLLIKNDGFLNT